MPDGEAAALTLPLFERSVQLAAEDVRQLADWLATTTGPLCEKLRGGGVLELDDAERDELLRSLDRYPDVRRLRPGLVRLRQELQRDREPP